VAYSIAYYNEAVQQAVLALPATLAARYVVLTRRMLVLGPNLGAPHTEPFGGGLFELRLRGQEGIARVFYCHPCWQAHRHAPLLHQEGSEGTAG
jgi:phage-related protein